MLLSHIAASAVCEQLQTLDLIGDAGNDGIERAWAHALLWDVHNLLSQDLHQTSPTKENPIPCTENKWHYDDKQLFFISQLWQYFRSLSSWIEVFVNLQYFKACLTIIEAVYWWKPVKLSNTSTVKKYNGGLTYKVCCSIPAQIIYI